MSTTSLPSPTVCGCTHNHLSVINTLVTYSVQEKFVVYLLYCLLTQVAIFLIPLPALPSYVEPPHEIRKAILYLLYRHKYVPMDF